MEAEAKDNQACGCNLIWCAILLGWCCYKSGGRYGLLNQSGGWKAAANGGDAMWWSGGRPNAYGIPGQRMAGRRAMYRRAGERALNMLGGGERAGGICAGGGPSIALALQSWWAAIMRQAVAAGSGCYLPSGEVGAAAMTLQFRVIGESESRWAGVSGGSDFATLLQWRSGGQRSGGRQSLQESATMLPLPNAAGGGRQRATNAAARAKRWRAAAKGGWAKEWRASSAGRAAIICQERKRRVWRKRPAAAVITGLQTSLVAWGGVATAVGIKTNAGWWLAGWAGRTQSAGPD